MSWPGIVSSFGARCVVLTALSCASVAYGQRILTVPDMSALQPRGNTLQVTQVVQTPDGGHIIAGRFSYWYEGRQRSDLLKLKADGSPDLAWAPSLAHVNLYANAAIAGVTAAPLGAFVLGDFESVNGLPIAKATILDWATGAPSPWPVSTNLSQPYAISNYDRTGDWVYVSHGPNGYYRIAGNTGRVDTSWNSPHRGGCTYVAQDPTQPDARLLLADGQSHLWSWAPGGLSPTDAPARAYLWRCDVQATTAVQATTGVSELANSVQLFAISGEYLYFQQRRFRLNDQQEDLTWSRPNAIRVTGQYVYSAALPLGTSLPTTVSRYGVVNGGEDPGWRFSLPDDLTIYFWRGQPHWWFAGSQSEDSAGVLLTDRFPASGAGTVLRGFMVKDDGKVEPEVQVVEYYAPALKRYFITGRAGEQTALDGLPQSFQRTGMKFTAKSSKYRDIAEQPVCRMYASPEKGMSNSHFYGIGSDCATLNKLSGLKYEGYDFSILKPTAEQACPAEASKPVTRLFNNKVASNESNHRYVVSAATKAKMLSQGWVDEGVVFCASAVTDAAN